MDERLFDAAKHVCLEQTKLAAQLERERDAARAALRDIADHDLIGLTGPAKIVAEAMRNTARAALAKAEGLSPPA